MIKSVVPGIAAVLTVLSALLFCVPHAFAHPLSVSYSSFTLDEQQVVAVYRLPMDDMDLLLRLDQDIDGTVTADELQRAGIPIRDYIRAWTTISLNGVAVPGELERLDVWQDSSAFPYVRATLVYPSSNMIMKVDASVNVLTNLYQDHRNLAEFILGDQREEHVFFRGTTWSGTRQMERSWQTAWQFMQLGIDHIFRGYDHILFLLGLLLVAGGLRNLTLIITSFTVAHSITLALSTLGLVRPELRLVEIIVALSIAWVGLENLIARDFRYRWVLTFIFGLAHGFGFASVLQNMELEREGLLLGLLMFNLGVEAGQLLIVAVFWPLLQQLQKTRHRVAIIRAASVVILAFGTLWLAERIL